MNKKQFIDYINSNYKSTNLEMLTNNNTAYSNINKAKDVWWFNIGIEKFGSDFNLILVGDYKSYWLHLPKGFCNSLESKFKIRLDKDAVDLEICADKSDVNYLKDIKSGGSNFDFKKYIQVEI
jgi:hypothetical protein